MLIPFHLCWCHSVFITKTCPHNQPTSQWLLKDERCPSWGLGQDSRSEAGCCSEARTTARDNKGYGWLHPSHPYFSQTMDSKAIGAQHQLHHQCCWGLRGWEDWGIHAMANVPIRNQEAIWWSTYWSLRMRTPQIPSHTRGGTGAWQCISMLDIEITPSLPCHPFVTRLPRRAREKFRHRHHPEWCPHHIRWVL